MNQETLRCIETLAGGEESAGSAWGLRYELLWFALGGVGVTILIVAALFWTGRESLTTLPVAVIPAVLTLGLAVFRQSKPKGYDTDLLDLWLHGPGFGPKPPDELPP